ncbi:PREDICTED: bone marrow stromal antigen 2-like [Chinchilla lanigera]|uniref:bone marrow stromal antigen 2-like n=1 Tax=Chinchilla lanigera TaxID=34839 RepID=UPI0006969B6E|nr:PREDICTED: bone marrow stromal antigen 2-like [Chinchilla lanigera]
MLIQVRHSRREPWRNPLPRPAALMPSSLCPYSRVPMDEVGVDKGRRGVGLRPLAGFLLGMLAMAVPLGYFAVKANSEACHLGLQAEERFHNVTQHLRDQLTRAQEALQDAYATCKSTVENLNASLSEAKTQEQKQREQVQAQKDEIADLKQKLQETRQTVQQLRNEISATRQRSPKSAAVSVGAVPAALLLPVLAALRP